MADRFRQISDLYHAALKRRPEERLSFLQQACSGDESLRQEIESLLRSGPGSERFLESPAANAAVSPNVDATTQLLGRTLGPYRIVAALGAGGMGEVYRAHDTKLGRDVAIKILPSHFTADPERRARFVREARVLATLSHPHIAAIYGLEEIDGAAALVLELVEGSTLAERLRRGAMPVPQAIMAARQIAEALEAAHDKGIIHRDLKPANVILQKAAADWSSSGEVRVKVLDFGLAKSLMPPGLDPAAEHRTVSFDGTREGRILGTPAYMSPEQATGQRVDARTDIWAFGCVLFQMLSGRHPFEGKTATDTVARLLEHEPDWSLLPQQTPAVVRTLIHRCLRKDPQKRLRDATGIRIELEDVEHDGHESAGVAPTRRRRPLAWIGTAALALAVSAIALYSIWSRPSVGEPVEFEVTPPAGARFTGGSPEFAVAPDGRHVVVAMTSEGISRLYIRSLETTALRQIPGTEGARSPFWRPDSQAVGFFANHQLKTVQLSGGSPVFICQVLALGDRGRRRWRVEPPRRDHLWPRQRPVIAGERRAGGWFAKAGDRARGERRCASMAGFSA